MCLYASGDSELKKYEVTINTSNAKSFVDMYDNYDYFAEMLLEREKESIEQSKVTRQALSELLEYFEVEDVLSTDLDIEPKDYGTEEDLEIVDAYLGYNLRGILASFNNNKTLIVGPNSDVYLKKVPAIYVNWYSYDRIKEDLGDHYERVNNTFEGLLDAVVKEVTTNGYFYSTNKKVSSSSSSSGSRSRSGSSSSKAIGHGVGSSVGSSFGSGAGLAMRGAFGGF